MPVVMRGKKYYRTAEVCRLAGMSRNTLFRWLKKGNLDFAEYRDCRGWRLFDEAQVDRIKQRTQAVLVLYRYKEIQHKL